MVYLDETTSPCFVGSSAILRTRWAKTTRGQSPKDRPLLNWSADLRFDRRQRWRLDLRTPPSPLTPKRFLMAIVPDSIMILVVAYYQTTTVYGDGRNDRGEFGTALGPTSSATNVSAVPLRSLGAVLR